MAGYSIGAAEVACGQTCILGEGPVWDHRIGRLHWVDIRGRAVLTLDPETGITSRIPTSEDVGFALLTDNPQVVVVGLKSGLSTLHLETGAHRALVEVDADKPTNRLNDGTVAPDGAILFGTLDMDHAEASGTFYRYHKGQLIHLGGSLVVTNGPGLNADGSMALTVDSIGRKIFRHAYVDGTFQSQGLFAEIPAGHGVPDGVAFDAEGFAWIAHYGGSRVTRFSPDGAVERVINLPAQQVTKCAFGGRDLRTLYITTAAYRRPLADEPLAGALFRIPVDVPGLHAHIAAL